MLTVYVPEKTNRIRYVFDFFFKERMGLSYQLTDSIEAFGGAADAPRISYGSKPPDTTVHFNSHYLLFEKGVKPQEIEMLEHQGIPCFFKLSGDDELLPFDPFAAAFFLLSRYEEYLPHQKDQHGRFPATESIAYRHSFLQLPVVDHYVLMVKRILQKHFPKLQFGERAFKFIPTYDIDSAFAYRNKGLIRNAGGLVADLTRFNFKEMVNRLNVMLGRRDDPFNTYRFMHQLHQKYHLKAIYFFLVGDYDMYDKNISINIFEYQSLIKSIADYADVGIHPSYASNEQPEKLKKEMRRLSNVLKRDIFKSRQHFLKLTLPDTYDQLMEFGIEEDYTMGYASHPGFRAGTCSPFYFYNLEQNNRTALKLFPFVLMDATYIYYLKQSPEKALQHMQQLIDEIKTVGGTFISLWHNNTFNQQSNDGYRWQKVYEQMVDHAVGKA